MTQPGTVLTITCLGCNEEFAYTYVSGRVRKFHDDQHKDAKGELTMCRWKATNARQRQLRADRRRAQRTSSTDATGDAHMEEIVRAVQGPPLSKADLKDLPGAVRQLRHSLALLLARPDERAPAEENLRTVRRAIEKNVLPVLDAVEKRLRA